MPMTENGRISGAGAAGGSFSGMVIARTTSKPGVAAAVADEACLRSVMPPLHTR
jgi:hypothetical protein